MILRVDTRSPVPPYEQIRTQVTAMVLGGALADGARLPPIRQLAHDLGLAGGTVARAYRELESEGVVVTRGRHGTTVVGPKGAAGAEQRHLALAAATFAEAATHTGAGVEDAVSAVRAAFAVRPQPKGSR